MFQAAGLGMCLLGRRSGLDSSSTRSKPLTCLGGRESRGMLGSEDLQSKGGPRFKHSACWRDIRHCQNRFIIFLHLGTHPFQEKVQLRVRLGIFGHLEQRLKDVHQQLWCEGRRRMEGMAQHGTGMVFSLILSVDVHTNVPRCMVRAHTKTEIGYSS